jgi:hypothetical protein
MTNYDKSISLSVYNRPKSLAQSEQKSGKKPEDYLKLIPGWKPPAAPTGTTEEPVLELAKREPKLPEFALTFALITKD